MRILEKLPNVTRLKAPTPECPITIIGDLHGELADLEQIFENRGSPGPNNIFVFNGDFVDRGSNGVEVMLVLLCMKVLHPEYIHLDRGNHEDSIISAAYGFKDEAIAKYSLPMFREFVRIFKALPLCTLIGQECPGKAIFVVHGGIFENRKVKIDDIDTIKRQNYSSVIAQKPRRKAPKEAKMIEDMTWSDPKPDNGLELSERGSGVMYGPDVTREFLKANGCQTIVRSHECIEDGLELINLGEGFSLYTVFSASNYSDGDNFGAFLTYTTLEKQPEVTRFRTREPPPSAKVAESNKVGLNDLICRRHFRLLRGFEAADPEKTGKVPQATFEAVMGEVLKISDIDWMHLGLQLPPVEGGQMSYNAFLDQYSIHEVGQRNVDENVAGALSSLYGNFKYLEVIFKTWDANHDGKVDRTEFTNAIAAINEAHPGEEQVSPDLFDLLDVDKSGSIDINELCETSRLTKGS